MAIRSQPYHLSWEEQAKSLQEVNERLSRQLHYANEMLEILFKAVADLTNRVEALE
jgi:hypothetical protein